MSEVRHTEGQWAVERNNTRIVVPGRKGFDGRPYRVADAYFSSAGLANTPSIDEAHANARLIASAPEMLAALKAVADLKGWTENGAVSATGRQVLAAISRATNPQEIEG